MELSRVHLKASKPDKTYEEHVMPWGTNWGERKINKIHTGENCGHSWLKNESSPLYHYNLSESSQ